MGEGYMKKLARLLFPLWVLLVLLVIYPQIRTNVGFVLANKSLGTQLSNQVRQDYWKRATTICLNSAEDMAKLIDHEAVILQFDSCYIDRVIPLIIVTDTVSFSAATLALGGLSKSNQLSNGMASLYGSGYLEAMVVPVEPAEMILSIQAFHHELPPVILEIWLNEEKVGELYFDKGDNSWEIIALPITVDSNFHRLRIAYTNDFYDEALEIDRNAFIRDIEISQ